ncbi:translocation/assembly module TamB domain-containing protein [Novosphingobium taihuense]|uniref:Translocation and assembly module TamB n=1 Tax=Novosphingobium taihuense TaxID=260085 RepID=A0A7W7AFW4_9SPHN|nr:translocation/assembly module TamB [Novosphingobium taihuense]MBB4615282.1 translocation and assembly module TamB [Novosphingobium taihuense]TWH84317.1 autotransporter secretion inner membrane protein TamB [Novosphingobium taihuense]
MADEVTPPAAEPTPPARSRRSRFVRGFARRVAILTAAGLALLLAALVILDSSLGHRLVADRIAAITPGSGLRIEIGRIDGSIYGAAKLRDIRVSDPEGVFLTVPEAELDWRPLAWLKTGLDVRLLALHRGVLRRAPRLRPSEDKNAPILPDFDIRIDKLVIDNLTVSEAMAGQKRRVDVLAKADIRGGHAIVDVAGKIAGDRVLFRLDSEPDRDKFELRLAYDAPKDGMIAKMAGAEGDIRADVFGRGGWSRWDGLAYATMGGKRLAAFQLGNQSGMYRLAGQAWPGSLVKGTAAQAVGPALSVLYDGTFADNAFDGALRTAGDAFKVSANGKLDLAQNEAEDLKVRALVLKPGKLISAPELAGVAIDATLDGAFSDLSIEHDLRVQRLKLGTLDAQGLRSSGTATWDGKRFVLPLAVTAQRVVTGNTMIDPRFPGARIGGDLVFEGSRLTSDNLSLAMKGLGARLALRGDMARGGYALAGPVVARGFAVQNLGAVDGTAKILFKIGKGVPWTLQANLAGRMTRIDNETLQTLTGGGVRFAGGLALGERVPITFRKATINSAKLQMALDGKVLPGGAASLTGSGRHTEYGPFTVEAAMTAEGPNAVLVFASPLPAAGLKDVRVALSPIADGFRIETGGESTLGPFNGTLGLFMPPGGATRIDIQQFRVWQTDVTGGVTLGKDGVAGQIALAGGGLNGTVALAPREGGQGFDANVTARNARFGGARPLSIGNAKVEATGLLKDGHSTIEGTLLAEGIGMGKVFIGKLSAAAYLQDGSGSVTAAVSGRRGTRFALQGTAAFSPDQIVAFVSGEYAGRQVSMPRRAVLTREGEGWRLSPTQIGFGRGILIAEGHVLGGPTQMRLLLSKMPLSVVDIVVADLGLGGIASGIVEYNNDGKGAPAGNAALMVKGLSRSGLVLTSRPVDVALVARLDPEALQMRTVIREGSDIRGRFQAIVSGLPRGGGFMDRLEAGRLAGQLRYSGPADALWRLTGVEVFDLTGPVGVRADVSGTISAPVLQGAVASKGMRVQSTLTGTDIGQVQLAGTFTDSTLQLASFSGTTANGGRVSGSGTIGLAELSEHGPSIDLRLSAQNAQLVNRDDMAATVTGPLRIVSNGVGGTIAGRVRIERARWALGRASAVQDLPVIATREVNAPADAAPAKAASAPWRFLIDAAGANRIDVRGLGLDSEWGADIRLRGSTAAPQIFGTADLVRGGYEFAGKRFELTRGRIRFAGEVPVDPQLDIVAEGDANNISAKITITGTGTKPNIAFSSTPALPEEELLSRILFGSSITQISAPEAVQLAAALASLRGGGGLDPINKLRAAIGLDRLRIVGADPTVGSGTSIAVGKYIGRRFFVELVTDGAGYSATSVEFRITRWLALLGTMSTIGDESLNLKVSKDY